MIGTLAMAFVVGMVTGLALVPLFKRAFRTKRYSARVLSASVFGAVVVLSLSTCYWLTGEPQGHARDATTLAWVLGFVPFGLEFRKAYLSRVR